MSLKRFHFILLIGTLLASNPACFGTVFEAFLKVPGIDGEATELRHKEWITILAFTNDVPKRRTVIRPIPLVKPSQLVLLKHLDKASPKLLQTASSGTRLNEMLLEFCVTGSANSFAFYQINLSNVVVRSVSQIGGASDAVPTEQLVLRYERIAWTYTTTTITGAPGERIGSYWDLIHNTGGMLSNVSKMTATQNEKGDILLNWSAQVGRTYKVYSSDIVDGIYKQVGEVVALGQVGHFSEPMLEKMRFYKVE
jgi:type VI secretion system Hcp family effector